MELSICNIVWFILCFKCRKSDHLLESQSRTEIVSEGCESKGFGASRGFEGHIRGENRFSVSVSFTFITSYAEQLAAQYLFRPGSPSGGLAWTYMPIKSIKLKA